MDKNNARDVEVCLDEARYRMLGANIDDCADEAALAHAILSALLNGGEDDDR